MRSQIRRIGNSFGAIIPADCIKKLGLAKGDDIEVKIDGNQIIIEPIQKPNKRFPFSEAELLNGLNAHTAHADELGAITNKEINA